MEFPESSVGHLLSINKQFFYEAVEIWTASKLIACDDARILHECMGHSRSVDRQVLQHIKEIKLSSWACCGADALTLLLPKLVRVSVRICPASIGGNVDSDIGFEGKALWSDSFTDADLARTFVVS